jgi:DNA repair photolyase
MLRQERFRRGTVRGRGAGYDPANRFERLRYEEEPPDERLADEPGSAPDTEFLIDPSRRVVAFNASPDVGFDASLNPYRGCEHGCIYCYARPTHEYLGFSAGLDFETRILVKPEAPNLLRKTLADDAWKPQVLALSGVTDPFQPIERRLRITRRCLAVLAELRHPVLVVTKSRLVTRDLDLLQELARFEACAVCISVTTLDPHLQRSLEPRAPRPELRLEAIAALASAGIPTGVMIAPVIPGLTDHEIAAIAREAARAGASFAGRVMLRLPHAVAPLFADWLERNFPDRKQKVLNRVRAVREGRLNDPRFGSRLRGSGLFAEQLHALFELACRREGLAPSAPPLSVAAFRRPQLRLFD